MTQIRQIIQNIIIRQWFAHFGFGVEDEAFVQSVSHTFDELFPDPVLQKLLRIHLKQMCFYVHYYV